MQQHFDFSQSLSPKKLSMGFFLFLLNFCLFRRAWIPKRGGGVVWGVVYLMRKRNSNRRKGSSKFETLRSGTAMGESILPCDRAVYLQTSLEPLKNVEMWRCGLGEDRVF